MKGDVEAVGVAWVSHRFESRCQSGGVAVLAPWADLVATGDGVPGGVRPLDARLLAHWQHLRAARLYSVAGVGLFVLTFRPLVLCRGKFCDVFSLAFRRRWGSASRVHGMLRVTVT